ncbi:MarR family transcriptional regulator [Clostridioides mangenotii]|uniref:MarR family winged helix-turn-helix transcriptional regulator n=1 Tax=Metaclostridioides mangenotii TaxID=1540 RepID=UPI001C102AA2|nr:MarR family transcriptional regulator [Clostridioides mangenotii]MBU5306785.1 MarR family transcriptional regulator [Clostridioides mangenotii]
MKNDNEDKLFKLVTEINELHYRMNGIIINEYQSLLEDDLSDNQTILMDIVKGHEDISVGEIARLMKITSSAVGQIVNKLEDKNYLMRSINPKNRREILVHLADKGKKYFENEEVINREIINRFYSQMELSEMEELKKILTKLNKIVEKNVQTGMEGK